MGIEINSVASDQARVLRPCSGRWHRRAWRGGTFKEKMSYCFLTPKPIHSHRAFGEDSHLKDLVKGNPWGGWPPVEADFPQLEQDREVAGVQETAQTRVRQT